MSFIDNPREAYLLYHYRKLKKPMTFAAFVAAFTIAPYFENSFRGPRQSVFTREGDPAVQISVRTESLGNGGLTPAQSMAMQEVIDLLPRDHVAPAKFIGVLPKPGLPISANGVSRAGAIVDYSGVIVIDNTRMNRNNMVHTLIHEIGHLAMHHVLTRSERIYWARIHEGSSWNDDFVSDYAESNIDENFAETYGEWTQDSYKFAHDAVTLAREKKEERLQKLFMMASLFAHEDGTMNFYTRPGLVTDYTGFNYGQRMLVITSFVQEGEPLEAGQPSDDDRIIMERKPYYRTADRIVIGDYTFRMAGRRVIAIADRTGRVIADRLSILIPDSVFERLKLTGPPPMLPQISPVVTDPVPSVPLKPETMRLISPDAPDQYVTVQSPEGFDALSADQAMISNPTQIPSYEDRIRQHGNFIPQ